MEFLVLRSGKKRFHLYKMKNGVTITCHGKPKKIDIQRLHSEFGLNYVLTILYPKEKPEDIKWFCEGISPEIHWENLSLNGASIDYFNQAQTKQLIINYVLSLLEYFKTHQNITMLVHCAAGMHRTGTVLYTILRVCGETPETVMEAIKGIRYDTFAGIGEKRIEYAENCLVAPLLEILSKNENQSFS